MYKCIFSLANGDLFQLVVRMEGVGCFTLRMIPMVGHLKGP